MPAVSVIVPIYNGEKFIHQCVDSILSQTFDDWELILVDVGSTDNCARICDEYVAADERVIVIHGTNKGVSIARNIGLAAASGEYVAFCDGDDYFKENLLERTYTIAKEQNADVVSFNLERLSQNGSQEVEESKALDIIDLDQDNRFDFLYKVATWRTKGWQACRSIFRRRIIAEHHIKFCDTCGNFAEDLGFTLEYLLYASRIVFDDEYLYIYYDVRQDSMMNRSKKVYKINEVNELSFYLRPRITAVLPDEPFCVLHHHILLNQLVDIYSANNKGEFREWDKRLKHLDNSDYFKEQNMLYYTYEKEQNGAHGLRRLIKYYSSKKSIIHCYWSSLNMYRLSVDLRLHKLVSLLRSCARKVRSTN